MRWDLFCRVIDNLGDAGVCWRLARDLAVRGEQVRLVIDDLTPLRRLAPAGAARVEVVPWNDALALADDSDVVVEAFGCDPPSRVIEQMARSGRPPCWVNLEYLSAEAHAVRSHGLPSPQLAGPGRGMTKWFFYPGFTPDSGGLLRENDLLSARASFARDAWLQAVGWPLLPTERMVVLFSYPHPALAAWLNALSAQPTLLLVPQGPAQKLVREALGPTLRLNALRAGLLPWLTQSEFDHLLWSADLNIVRGEDSLVRALWSGVPFAWQLYPQHDGAHRRKLQAFLERWQADTGGALPANVAHWFAWWNDAAALALPPWPAAHRWRDAVLAWREVLARQSDLTTRLTAFVAAKKVK